ncbi:hypothetical protein HDU76_000191, partial [Blyttiomyces sp. JEL0837]
MIPFGILVFTLHAIIAVTLLIFPAQAAFSVTINEINSTLTYSATQVSSDTAKICIQGNIASNQLIGFGIPAPNAIGMIDDDLVLSYPTPPKDLTTRGPVSVLLGFGVQGQAEFPTFSDNGLSQTDSSSYDNGLLKACFLRPFPFTPTGENHDAYGKPIPQNVLNQGPAAYLWALGNLNTFA